MCLFLGQGFFCSAQSRTYTIDSENSQIMFSVKHLGILNVDGEFHDFEGEVIFQDKHLDAIKGKVHVKSIDTNDDSRDKVLLGEAYLDSKTYAMIQFDSTEMDTSLNTISSELTIKNVTRSIVLTIQVSEGENKITLSTKISRKNFKLDFGSMNGLIGDAIKIEAFINY